MSVIGNKAQVPCLQGDSSGLAVTPDSGPVWLLHRPWIECKCQTTRVTLYFWYPNDYEFCLWQVESSYTWAFHLRGKNLLWTPRLEYNTWRAMRSARGRRRRKKTCGCACGKYCRVARQDEGQKYCWKLLELPGTSIMNIYDRHLRDCYRNRLEPVPGLTTSTRKLCWPREGPECPYGLKESISAVWCSNQSSMISHFLGLVP